MPTDIRFLAELRMTEKLRKRAIILGMQKQVVRFVVNEDLDIENHLINLWTYKNKNHSFTAKQSERYEKLLKLSPAAQRRFIAKEIDWRYSPSRKKMLNVLAKDMNVAWAKMEKDFIRRIEKVHDRPFAFSSIRGVLSCGDWFGYNVPARVFAANMFRNTFAGGTDNATHELMHFMFHTYYQKTCEEQGLSGQQIWDIKESLTVLLNLEFDDLRFGKDIGYPGHEELRDVIQKAWLRYHDFEKTLEKAIMFVKKKNAA